MMATQRPATVYDANCVCAGQLIDCEGVPGGTATIGTACDDGNAATGNDVYDANCVCAGQLIDCEGVPGGTATVGTSCDDGNAATGNDVYDANCVCAGQLIDCEGVPGGSATVGSACDDGNAATGNDVYDANCVCAGQLIDCEGVPGGSATVGSACDDGNAATGNDVYGANCVCAGTPIGACTGDQVVVSIYTDANPGHLLWEISNSSGTLIASGSPATANTLVSEMVCLNAAPVSACYGFRIYDNFGDGIANGGWELRTTDGKLILRDSFSSGSESPADPQASPGYGSAHSFCLPLGPVNIAPTECGIMNNLMGNKGVRREMGRNQLPRPDPEVPVRVQRPRCLNSSAASPDHQLRDLLGHGLGEPAHPGRYLLRPRAHRQDRPLADARARAAKSHQHLGLPAA